MRLKRFFKGSIPRSQPPSQAQTLVSNRSLDGCRHLINRCHTVNGLQQALPGIVGHQRCRLLLVDVEALAQHFLGVVGPGTARLRGALYNTAYQLVCIGFDLDHGIKLDALVDQHGVQRFGLRNGAREAIKNETGFAIGCVQTLRDDAVDNGITDQITTIHYYLGLKPQRGLGRNRRAQDVTGGQLGDIVGLDQDLGLSPLPRSGWSEQYQSHRRLPPPRRDFLTSPSYCWATRWLWIWLTVSRVTVTMISSDVPPMNWLTAS